MTIVVTLIGSVNIKCISLLMAEIETAQTKRKVIDTSSLNEAYTVNQNYIDHIW